METTELKNIAAQIRRDCLRMVYAVKSGHIGGALGCADFFTSLYFKHLKHDAKSFTVEGKNQDHFYLSNGHISSVFYSTLARCGYFNVKELSTFRIYGTRLQGHPCVENEQAV